MAHVDQVCFKLVIQCRDYGHATREYTNKDEARQALREWAAGRHLFITFTGDKGENKPYEYAYDPCTKERKAFIFCFRKRKVEHTHMPRKKVWLAFPTSGHRMKFRRYVEYGHSPGSANLEDFTWPDRYVMSVDCVNAQWAEDIKLVAIEHLNGLLCDGNGKIKLDYSDESEVVRTAMYRVARETLTGVPWRLPPEGAQHIVEKYIKSLDDDDNLISKYDEMVDELISERDEARHLHECADIEANCLRRKYEDAKKQKPASLEHIGKLYGVPVWLEIEDQHDSHVRLARDHIVGPPRPRRECDDAPRRKKTLSSKVAERVTRVIREEMSNAAFGEYNLPRTPMTFVDACDMLRRKLELIRRGKPIVTPQLEDAIRTVLAYVTK